MTTPNADALSALLSETLREEKAVSEERVRELREWCQPRLNATEGVKQPKDSWQTLTAICDELLALRAQMRWVSVEELNALRWAAATARGQSDNYDGAFRALGELKTLALYATALRSLASRLSQSAPPTQVSTPSSEGL